MPHIITHRLFPHFTLRSMASKQDLIESILQKVLEDYLERENVTRSVKNWIGEGIRTCEEIGQLIYEWDEHELRESMLSLECSRIISEPNFCREHVIRSPRHRNAGDHHYHWNLSSLLYVDAQEQPCGTDSLCQEQQIALLRAPEECPLDRFTSFGEKCDLLVWTYLNKEMQRENTKGNRFSQLDNNESYIDFSIVFMEALDRDGKMTSLLQDNSTGCDPKKHKHKETVPRARDTVFQHGDTFRQHKHMKTVQRVSSFVFSTIAFLGIFFNIWSQLSIFQVLPLHKERDSLSIWSSLLGFMVFMVFVWAVAIMILVGAPFTRMHSALLVLWSILMLLQSGDSINAVFVPILGIFFMGCNARGKVQMMGGNK